MQKSKVDAIVEAIMDAANGKGNGFVLDLAAGPGAEAASELEAIAGGLGDTPAAGRLRALAGAWRAPKSTVIQVGKPLPPVDEYEAPSALRRHTITDTRSFVEFAKRYGKPDESLVLASTEGMTLVLKEVLSHGDRELIRYPFPVSDDWKAWGAVIGKQLGHKTLVRFMASHEHNLEDPSNLAAMRKMKMQANTTFDSDVGEAGDGFAIAYKTNAGEMMAQFKRKMALALPVFDADVGDPNEWENLDAKLDVEMPDFEGEHKTPQFTVTCSMWNQTFRARALTEAERVSKELGDGWLVVMGEHATVKREVGRKVVHPF